MQELEGSSYKVNGIRSTYLLEYWLYYYKLRGAMMQENGVEQEIFQAEARSCNNTWIRTSKGVFFPFFFGQNEPGQEATVAMFCGIQNHYYIR